MKKTFLVILCAVTVVCIVLGSCIHFGVFGKTVKKGEGSYEQILNESFSTLETDLSVGNITVKRGNTAVLSVECSDSRFTPEYSLSGGMLRITQPKVRQTFTSTGVKCNVEVTVPYELVKIKVFSDVGNCRVEEISSVEFSVSSDVGNCIVEDSKATKLTVESDTGNVKIRNTLFDTCDAKSDVGNVTIELPSEEKAEDYTVTLLTDVGNVHAFGSSYKRNFSQGAVSGSKRIHAESDVGNVRLD